MSTHNAAAVDKPSKAGELLGTSLFLTLWGTFFVGARIYTRIFQTKSFGWDDGFILLSCLAGWAAQGLIIAQIRHGLGTPSATFTNIADVIAIGKFSNFAIFCNGIAMASLKVGIGASLLRLRLGKLFNAVVWGSIVLSCVVNLTVLVTTFAKCSPMEKIWDRSLSGTCWPGWADLVTSYGQTSGNILTDLLFSLGPLYFLAKVKVSHYNRWALRGVFVIGLVATACAVAKCTQLPALAKATTDFTYDTVPLDMWVLAELNCGLMAASLPPLKSTFEHLLIRWFHVRSGLTTPSNTHTFGSNGYAVHSYGPGTHKEDHETKRSGGGGNGIGSAFNFSRKRNSTTNNYNGSSDNNGANEGVRGGYAMDKIDTRRSNRNRRRDPDEISTDDDDGEEEDQKYILQGTKGAEANNAAVAEGDGGDGSMKTMASMSEDEMVRMGSRERDRERSRNRAGSRGRISGANNGRAGSRDDGGDRWITKTVEYTVRDDESIRNGR